MSLLRAFIAIDIPPEIRQAISHETAGLRQACGRAVRWVATENIHLTLKFLGEVSSANLELLRQSIHAECAQTAPFEISVAGLGCFPNPRHPRVLWVGLSAPSELTHLQRQIENAATRLGYTPEEKPFSPHLTIGRVREQITPTELQTLRKLLEQSTVSALGTFTVREVHIYKSELRPEGPQYSRLATAQLQKNG
ncbi:MAG: RNA 2',3'-cyclic phosphodiesterase [Anaerolineae bacterium]|nr:MAG: RNA 2',3'-cyclic phosphodiesterase [Anaerolineae bacterium]